MIHRPLPLSAARGSSLVELLMVVIVLGIVSVVVAPILTTGFRTLSQMRDFALITGEGELAMDRMSRELRGIDPSADFSSSSRPAAGSVTITLYNGTPQAESVTYSLSGTELRRNNDTLASNVSSLVFTYCNRAGTALGTPLSTAQAASVWIMGITIVLTTREGNETLTSSVFLRSGPISR